MIGATLDRNGLRPARYLITNDGLVGDGFRNRRVAVQTRRIETKGRLQPGKMLLVDLEQGRLVPDKEIKAHFLRASLLDNGWLKIRLRSIAAEPSRM